MPEKDFLGHSWGIWIAVTLSVVLRVLAEPPKGETLAHRLFALSFAVVAGFAVGIYFYAPVVDWRGLNPETWNVPIALVLGFSAQSLIRFMMNIIEYEKLKEILLIWRGGKK